VDQAIIIKAFGAFFAIMNPFVNLPIFLAMTTGMTVTDQRRMAIKVILFASVMCAVLLLTGQRIIDFFGITVDEFRVAGGIVVASIAWSMLNGSTAASHHGSGSEKEEISDLSGMAFYPMTFPMVVGPGTIATIIIYTSHASGVEQLLAIGVVVAIILALLFLVFYFASYFGKVLSATMRVIMTRLMGMILLAISVEMILAGIKVILPGLA
jgi:multiple antibiotic resistance protein